MPFSWTFLGTIVYNAYIDGLIKTRDSQRALAVFQRMKRDNCEPNTETYTMVINLYGKVLVNLMADAILFRIFDFTHHTVFCRKINLTWH